MHDISEHLDIGSRVTILITAILFVTALFVKGFGHDLLLEAGVFLVSVKLITMAYKNSLTAKRLDQRLDRIERALGTMESSRLVK